MGVEIERKFLVKDDSYKNHPLRALRIRQGYLCREPERTVRVRITGNDAFITIKGKNNGLVRLEFEYRIPVADAEEILCLCAGKIIDKTRYIINYKGYNWEIDEFHNLGYPLTTAEVELPSADAEIEIPHFIGEEVSGDSRYYNSML